MELNEVIIISRLKDGDEMAYELLFKEYALMLTSYANSIVGDTDLAKEVVQELFVGLWENRRNLQIKQSIKSYLFISIRNNAIKAAQRKLKEKQQLADLNFNTIENFGSEMELIEFREQIYRAIENLPDKTRTYFKLSRFEKMTYDEISKELDVSKKNVEYHISKAIRILHESILFILYFF